MILPIFLISVAILYAWWAYNVYVGWQFYASKKSIAIVHEVGISVVIAFRNEAENLPALLNSINALNYPSEKFEIILVNDHSQDASEQCVTDWIKKTRIKVRLLQSPVQGKKRAQYLGVHNAAFQIIACTDADCVLHDNWLKRINEVFQNDKTELAFGPVEFLGPKKPFQKLEFLALIGSTMAMLLRGWAVMGNAANMSFRKQSYLSVFPSLEAKNSVSGDDVFLLHEIAKKEGSIAVLAGEGSIVKTLPQADLKSLFSQRLRWASKTKSYASKTAVAVALLIFLINTLLLSLLVAAIYSPTGIVAFVVLFTIKLFCDYFLLRAFSRFFKQRLRAEIFILQELINFMYVPLVAILSQLIPFSWKGRRY